MLRVRQLFDPGSSTYTYLVWDEATREAALIDPVREQLDRDAALVEQMGLTLRWALDTHVHADHVTAAGALRDRLGVRTVMGKKGAACADLQLGDGDEIRIGNEALRVIETPGHTDDSLSYLAAGSAENPGFVFTGDALLVRGCGRTDFQNGDPDVLFDSVTQRLFALPDDTIVWPAHDYKGFTASTIGEEKRCNPRLGGTTREQFVAIMKALNLPPPAKIAEAVPANRACGAPVATAQGAALQG